VFVFRLSVQRERKYRPNWFLESAYKDSSKVLVGALKEDIFDKIGLVVGFDAILQKPFVSVDDSRRFSVVGVLMNESIYYFAPSALGPVEEKEE
jgi:hypothetical protein